ncbi:MAG: alpha-E domain-containing protein [Bacillus sp. (in: firmicutes)]
MKILEESGEENNHLDWQSVLDICASSQEFERSFGEFTTHNAVEYLAFSNKNINSLANTTNYIRENARMIRDTIPHELWEEWNDFYWFLQQEKLDHHFLYRDMYYFLQRIKTTVMTATGIIHTSMPRDLPYHFMKIGKWLERAEKTARIMQVLLQRVKTIGPEHFNEKEGKFALQLVNGYEDFSRKYRLQDTDRIFQFLLTDRTFPRSVLYCMEHVKKVIMEIEREKVAHYSWEMFVALDDIIILLNSVNMQQLNFHETETFIDAIVEKCIKFGKVFSETYYLVEAVVNE